MRCFGNTMAYDGTGGALRFLVDLALGAMMSISNNMQLAWAIANTHHERIHHQWNHADLAEQHTCKDADSHAHNMPRARSKLT